VIRTPIYYHGSQREKSNAQFRGHMIFHGHGLVSRHGHGGHVLGSFWSHINASNDLMASEYGLSKLI